MRSTLRSIGAVIAGFIATSLVMITVEGINGRVLYPELAKAAEGVTDRETIRALLAAAPVGALLVVIAGWMLGGVAGGWVTAKLATRGAAGHAMVLAGLLTCAGIANNLMIPPPLWFWIASLVVFMPATLLGARFVGGGPGGPARSTRTQMA
jgi:hypothetical protein